MSTINDTRVTLRARRRWFFWPLLIVLLVAGKMGLIRDRLSAAHHGGIETGPERAARWLADHAMRLEVD